METKRTTVSIALDTETLRLADALAKELVKKSGYKPNRSLAFSTAIHALAKKVKIA